MDYEHIINVHKRAFNRAKVANDPRAEDYGRRLTHWISVADANGHFEDVGSAFNNGRMKLGGNVLVLS